MTSADQSGLSRDLDGIFSNPGADARWSCIVTTVADGAVRYARNPDRAQPPASNLKLLTAAAALHKLGPDYQPATEVIAAGPLADGVLAGNLLFAGRGAIHFSGRYLDSPEAMNAALEDQLGDFADLLRRCGVKRIRGRLAAAGDDWGETRYPGYPAASPLQWHENTVDVVVRAGTVAVCPEPRYGFALRESFFDGGQRRPRFTLWRVELIEYNPRVDSTDYWRLERTDPDRRYLMHLRDGLERHGIVIDGQAMADGDHTALCRLPGRSVASMLPAVLSWSDNLRAELLFRSLGYAHGANADADSAGRVATAVLTELAGHNDRARVVDGSGLSGVNHFSSRQIAGLLRWLRTGDHWQSIADALAVAGERGTLRNVLKHPDLRGRVIGKTGTIRNAKCLSGILTTPAGTELCFAFLCENPADGETMWRTFERALLTMAKESTQ